jgi:meckelin
MFDENLHGYYIHGRSPFGQAEISQEEIRKNLYFESTGKAQMRGILNEDPDLQTYEIFIPQQLMMHYRSEYMNEVTRNINDANQQNTQYLSNVQNTFNVRPAIPKNMDVE